MIILSPATATPTFNAITRLQVCDIQTPGSIIITDQDTNISYTIPASDYTHSFDCKTGWYETYSNIVIPNDSFGNFILREETFYTLRIKDALDSAVVYRDIIFSTEQDISKYTIQTTGNDPTTEAYKEHETTNEYIVL